MFVPGKNYTVALGVFFLLLCLTIRFSHAQLQLTTPSFRREDAYGNASRFFGAVFLFRQSMKDKEKMFCAYDDMKKDSSTGVVCKDLCTYLRAFDRTSKSYISDLYSNYTETHLSHCHETLSSSFSRQLDTEMAELLKINISTLYDQKLQAAIPDLVAPSHNEVCVVGNDCKCSAAHNELVSINSFLAEGEVFPGCGDLDKRENALTDPKTRSIFVSGRTTVVERCLFLSESELVWVTYKQRVKNLIAPTFIQVHDNTFSVLRQNSDLQVSTACKGFESVDVKKVPHENCAASCRTLELVYGNDVSVVAKGVPFCRNSSSATAPPPEDINDANANVMRAVETSVLAGLYLDQLLEKRLTADLDTLLKDSVCLRSAAKDPTWNIPDAWCRAVCSVLELKYDKSSLLALENKDVFDCKFVVDESASEPVTQEQNKDTQDNQENENTDTQDNPDSKDEDAQENQKNENEDAQENQENKDEEAQENQKNKDEEAQKNQKNENEDAQENQKNKNKNKQENQNNQVNSVNPNLDVLSDPSNAEALPESFKKKSAFKRSPTVSLQVDSDYLRRICEAVKCGSTEQLNQELATAAEQRTKRIQQNAQVPCDNATALKKHFSDDVCAATCNVLTKYDKNFSPTLPGQYKFPECKFNRAYRFTTLGVFFPLLFGSALVIVAGV